MSFSLLCAIYQSCRRGDEDVTSVFGNSIWNTGSAVVTWSVPCRSDQVLPLHGEICSLQTLCHPQLWFLDIRFVFL